MDRGISVRDYLRGDIVARQGNPATMLYLVGAGFLKVVQGTAAGHELIVRFVGPGEPFGGVVALEGAAYPVTAVRATYASGVLARDALRPLLDRHPQVRANLMREMAAADRCADARAGAVDRTRGAAARLRPAASHAPVRPS